MPEVNIIAFPKYEPRGPSSRLRFYQFEPEFQKQGVCITYHPLFGDAYVQALVSGQPRSRRLVLQAYWQRFWHLLTLHAAPDALLWIEKELFPYVPAWIERCLLARFRCVVLDYDDAVFQLYLYHRNPGVRWVLGPKIASLLRGADGVQCGSRFLDAYAQESGARNRGFLPTCIRLSAYRVKSYVGVQPKTPVVGWIGTPSSAGNLAAIRTELNAVAQRFPFRLILIGSGKLDWSGDAFELETRDWDEAREVNQILEFDVGIMPLEDSPFNRGKCGFKLIQYMACAIPVVASPVGENSVIVSDGIEGFLASESEQWQQSLQALLSDFNLRQKMGRAGRLRVEQYYCVEQQFANLMGFLQSTLWEREGRASERSF